MNTNQKSTNIKNTKDIFLQFQKIAYTNSLEIAGNQFLARVKVDDGEFVTPNSDDRSQMAWDVVDQETVEHIKTLRKEKMPDGELYFLKVSMETLLNESNLSAFLDLLSDTCGDKPDCYILELHEDVDEDLLDDIWDVIKERGFGIALDNYGRREEHKVLLLSFPFDFCVFDAQRVTAAGDGGAVEYCNERRIGSLIKRVENRRHMLAAKITKATLVQGDFVSAPELIHQGIQKIVN